MAVPFYVHARAALAAELHVQIEVTAVELPRVTPGEARLRGRVARVFRGPAEVAGTSVTVGVDCCREGDDIPPSAAVWTAVDHLTSAKVLEAFLVRRAGGYEIASWQSCVLDALTDTPTLVITEADTREPPRPSPWGLAWGLLPLVLFAGAGIAGIALAVRLLMGW